MKGRVKQKVVNARSVKEEKKYIESIFKLLYNSGIFSYQLR